MLALLQLNSDKNANTRVSHSCIQIFAILKIQTLDLVVVAFRLCEFYHCSVIIIYFIGRSISKIPLQLHSDIRNIKIQTQEFVEVESKSIDSYYFFVIIIYFIGRSISKIPLQLNSDCVNSCPCQLSALLICDIATLCSSPIIIY